VKTMRASRSRIQAFIERGEYSEFVRYSLACRGHIREKAEGLYRAGQEFASEKIAQTRDQLLELLDEH